MGSAFFFASVYAVTFQRFTVSFERYQESN
jgi:hypothetical protein